LNKYETIIIISPDIEAGPTEAIVENVQALMSENNCQITKVNKWGKRKLAYEIGGHKEGYYVLMNYTAEPNFIQRLSQYCSLNEAIIKYMTVRAEKLPEARKESLRIDDTTFKRAGMEDEEDEFDFIDYEDDYEDDYDN